MMFRLSIVLLTILASACADDDGEQRGPCDTVDDCSAGHECQANTCVRGGVEIDRRLRFEFSSVAGFDDFGSPGAALVYAVDPAAQAVLVVALRFQLPLYRSSFSVGDDPLQSAVSYQTAAAVAPLVDDVAAVPLLAAGLTDTAGIRTMGREVTAILLEGNLQSATPSAVFVADLGTVELVREDGPYDSLEGSLRLVEVSGLGVGAEVVAGGEVLEIERFYLEWDTGEQP